VRANRFTHGRVPCSELLRLERSLNQTDELTFVEGLTQKTGAATLPDMLFVVFSFVGGHQNCRQMFISFLQFREDLVAIHRSHLYVDDYAVGQFALKRQKKFGSGGAGVYVVACGPQQALHRDANCRFVVNDRNGSSFLPHVGTIGPSTDFSYWTLGPQSGFCWCRIWIGNRPRLVLMVLAPSPL